MTVRDLKNWVSRTCLRNPFLGDRMGESGGDSCRAVPNRVHVSPREGDEDQRRNEEMRREAVRTEGSKGREGRERE